MDQTTPSRKRRYPQANLEERREVRRKALMSAGIELFGTKGYRACSVKMVCNRASLTERYFYESFANREALLVDLFDSVAADVDARLRQIVDHEGYHPEERIQQFLDAFFHYVHTDARRARVLLFEILGVSPRVDRHYQKAVRNLAALVEHPNLNLFGTGSPRSKDARRVISIGLVGAILQIAIQWVLDEFSTSPDKVITNALEIFLAVSSDHRLDV
ncbi:TetR/AcrR family transcriptional regulator [Gilvimarinus sp. F26214L]|uniref:TetR/AcrR family transcriptional regulator n=1 Tax=Gilvimarinus sp. DZF01 TaxID=3461371 RepID=UPI0040467F81